LLTLFSSALEEWAVTKVNTSLERSRTLLSWRYSAEVCSRFSPARSLTTILRPSTSKYPSACNRLRFRQLSYQEVESDSGRCLFVPAGFLTPSHLISVLLRSFLNLSPI